MDLQTAFNIVVGLLGFLGGWVLNNLHAAMRDLQRADSLLADKVQAIEVLVAGQYVRRADLDHHMTAIFRKLDRIEEKLDDKADK